MKPLINLALAATFLPFFTQANFAEAPNNRLGARLIDDINFDGIGLVPYEIENSLLRVINGDDQNVYDFIYLADNFVIATGEQGELSMYSSIEPHFNAI